MCTVLLPPGDNPIAVNKYIISYIKLSDRSPEDSLQRVVCNVKNVPLSYASDNITKNKYTFLDNFDVQLKCICM